MEFIIILLAILKLISDKGAKIQAREQVDREREKEQNEKTAPSKLLQIHDEMTARKQVRNGEQQPTARNRRAGRISH